MEINELNRIFEEKFGRPAEKSFFAPGRINLIGEHTDYNGGHVFPCAITQGTYGIVALRKDELVRGISLNFEEEGLRSFKLDEELAYTKEDSWLNYLKGVIKYIKELTSAPIKGFDILIFGDIPNGAGLSSSSSLELLIGVMVNQLNGLNLPRLDLIKIGQKVENQFLGLQTGIMDQFVIGMGKKDHAVYLDTNQLEYELVPADLGEYVILIMNTNKRRELTTSKYNERRSQCEEALSLLQKELSISSLGELTNKTFEEHRHLINDQILEARAKHAVYENSRTQEAVKFLKAGNLKAFGELLNESHVSLRDDYDVTGVELDTLVASAWKQAGVLGARMTGAGMGGCAIALVHQDQVKEIEEAVAEEYEAEIGYAPSFYIARIGDGAKELSLT